MGPVVIVMKQTVQRDQFCELLFGVVIYHMCI
jgi:hypothetical protein